MHAPLPEQGRWLGQVVRGYFAYHAVPTNAKSLCAFRHHVPNLWRRSLRRRSQRDRTTWDRAAQLVAALLPAVGIIHPWPHERFAVNHPRWKPGGANSARRVLCGGRSAMSVPTAIAKARGTAMLFVSTVWVPAPASAGTARTRRSR